MQRALLSLLAVCVVGLLGYGRTQLADSRTVDVIRSYGYNAEQYNVTTKDGYILALTRIKSASTKLPVLMMHGVIAASDQWVLRGPGEDLAFMLVDEGHDVWIADQRGNTFSRKHEYLNTTDPEYWDFSFHESGLYDLPVFINTVLQQSGTDQLYYVGHSMGTTVFYVLCSLNPEYNQRIRMAVHLAPIAFGVRRNMPFVLQMLLQNADALADTLRKQKTHVFLPRIARNLKMVDEVCSDGNKVWCLLGVNQVFGKSSVTNMTKLRSYLKVLQSGTSVKTMLHLSQIYKSKNFAYFDYGKKQNFELYNSKIPPAYPLEKVATPVALFYGNNDVFIDDSSIERLKRLLPNVVASVSIPEYNHIDVVFADNTPTVLFNKIIKLLNEY